ncbi:hypothetical protein CLV42_11861 [Chitinophaga ginsengisoli]|uniref:Uncharacterized protein n=1 Tax=Chitinophaga ginsengisoli TaxID=363837 RepID=A0A2P8FNW0_9BACT|nr:hypothetical protein CLV42_11861 [Chitinophaga ginsengisoli]
MATKYSSRCKEIVYMVRIQLRKNTENIVGEVFYNEV